MLDTVIPSGRHHRGWRQVQSSALPLGLVAAKFAPHTLIGAAAAFVIYSYVPVDFDWFVPLLAGLLVSIPLVVLSSSPLLGRLAREDRFFLVLFWLATCSRIVPGSAQAKVAALVAAVFALLSIYFGSVPGTQPPSWAGEAHFEVPAALLVEWFVALIALVPFRAARPSTG